MKIGFLVNPIAGMGGKVGLKGTDGVYNEAVERGAEPVSSHRARRCLRDIDHGHQWYTPGGVMGEAILKEFFSDEEVIVVQPTVTEVHLASKEDTREAVRAFLDEDVDIILFCGGDGTARDIFEVVGKEKPILGIPAGVKMHSGVFGVDPEAAAALFNLYAEGRADLGMLEIMDLDEDLYRSGRWEIKLHGEALSLNEPHYIQLGKQSFRAVGEEDIKHDIASYMIEEMERYPGHLFVLGPGSTTAKIQELLELDHTVLGVDILMNKKILSLDVSEESIMDAAADAEGIKIVVSVIGNQGFFLGRGNQQISSKVVRQAGLKNIYIISTPAKLQKTKCVRVDTGDPELDREIREKGYMRVVQGFREYRIVPVGK